MATPSSSAVRFVRNLAWLILGLGWIVPLAATRGAAKGAPGTVNLFRWIAGLWLVMALFYAVVLAVRVRRGLVE